MAQRKRLKDDPLLAMSAVSTSKKRRLCLTIKEKLALLDRVKAGERVIDLSRELEIGESTIHTILRSESSIRIYAQKCTKNEYESVAYMKKKRMLNQMEQRLYEWDADKRRKGNETPKQDFICARARARALYEQLKREEPDLVAANNDEQLLDALEFIEMHLKIRKRDNWKCNADVSSYPATFSKLLQTADYQPHQVFHAIEFSFPWKRLPNMSFTAAAKTNNTLDRMLNEHISLLFCSNARGNFYIKPILIQQCKMPLSLRSIKTNDLPVFWRSGYRDTTCLPKVAQSHFHDWLTQCFTPSVRNYLQLMDMPQRCLLLLNSDFQQMVLPAYDDAFLRLEYLPAHARNTLQPLAQSVLPIFYCKYLQRFQAHLQQCAVVDTEDHLYQAWHKYNIADAINIIHKSLEDISMECCQSGWHLLWPGIGDKSCFNTHIIKEIEQTWNNRNQLSNEGFAEITYNDMELHVKLEADGAQRQTLPEAPVILNQVIVNSCDNSFKDIFVQETDDNLSEKGELISLCSDQDSEEDVKDDYDLSEERDYNMNETNNNMDSQELLVTEYKLSEDEALIEYHETGDLAVDETASTVVLRTPRRNNNMQIQRRHKDAQAKVQIIDKAFELKRQLADTLEQLRAHETFSTFKNDLNSIMQPYVEFRKKLLQPTIKDYFK